MEINGLYEADVTINGERLTFAQSMTLRVAIGSFLMSLGDHEMRKALGPELARGYEARANEINVHIFRGLPQ